MTFYDMARHGVAVRADWLIQFHHRHLVGGTTVVSKIVKFIELMRDAQIKRPAQFRLLFEIAARHE